MRAKNKVIGGVEYMVIGSTMVIGNQDGFQIVRKSYTTYSGKVVVEGGKVHHPDGTTSPE